MMIKVDGVIFDVDGTLWDSTYVVKDAWNDAIVKAGYDNPGITADRLRGLFGLPMDDIIKDIMPKLNREERDKLAPFVYEYEHNYLEAKEGEYYEDILAVMRTISEKIPVYIVSNCQGGYIELFMRKGKVEDIVTDHLCPADTGKLKADNIRMIIDKYDVKNPLYVGDTVMDEKASHQAECPFCFASYGFGQSDDHEYEISKPAELLELLCL